MSFYFSPAVTATDSDALNSASTGMIMFHSVEEWLDPSAAKEKTNIGNAAAVAQLPSASHSGKSFITVASLAAAAASSAALSNPSPSIPSVVPILSDTPVTISSFVPQELLPNVSIRHRDIALQCKIDSIDVGLRIRSDSLAIETSLGSVSILDFLSPSANDHQNYVFHPPQSSSFSSPSLSSSHLLRSRPLLSWNSFESDSSDLTVSWSIHQSQPWLSMSLDINPPSDVIVSSIFECKVCCLYYLFIDRYPFALT